VGDQRTAPGRAVMGGAMDPDARSHPTMIPGGCHPRSDVPMMVGTVTPPSAIALLLDHETRQAGAGIVNAENLVVGIAVNGVIFGPMLAHALAAVGFLHDLIRGGV